MLPVTAISVAYNSAVILPDMVDSLPPSLPIVIVDNGPDDGMRAWAAARGITALVSPTNLGFGSGCNLGATRAETEFLLFINPDARLGPATLNALLAAAARHPEASAFGPVMLDDTGRARYKRNSYLLPRTAKPPRDPGPDDRIVGVLSGAVLMVRRTAFQSVGGFDPAIFLYFEDDDLALRLTQTFGPLMLVPSARARHALGHSSAPSPALSRFKGHHWARSRIHVGRKHRRTLPWLSGFWDALSHLLSPRSWSNPEHRAEALGRLSGALSILCP
jgi:N-acetylglucosaminyl-diphospho-decaprenol L-rhamnosyltransferase